MLLCLQWVLRQQSIVAVDTHSLIFSGRFSSVNSRISRGKKKGYGCFFLSLEYCYSDEIFDKLFFFKA